MILDTFTHLGYKINILTNGCWVSHLEVFRKISIHVDILTEW